MSFKLTKSLINSYITCPRQFKYQSIDKLPSEQGEAARIGSEIHEIADKFIQNYRHITDYDKILEILMSFDEYNDDYLIHCENLAKFFVEIFVEKSYEFVAAEEYILNKEYNFSGKSDLVLRDNNGKLFVVDYKTGMSSNVKKYKLELCYYKMLNEGFYGEEVGGAAIYFTKDGILSSLEFSNEYEEDKSNSDENSETINNDNNMICYKHDYNLAINYIDTVRLEIDAEKFPPRRSYICNFCSFTEKCAEDSGFREV